jgi:LysM repeat protein
LWYTSKGLVPFSFSGTGVTKAWRRDLNQTLIQQDSQTADAQSGLASGQHHIEVVKARLQLFLEMVFSLLVVAIPLSVHAGIFTDIFAEEVATSTDSGLPVMESPADVPLLSAQQNPDPLGGRGGSDVVVDENALVSTGPIGEDEIAASDTNNGEISVYTVREGDSLSQIAEMFGVTSNTIMWANDITKSTGIRPGDTLVILPIAGVRHIVKSGDTINSIAGKYEGNVDEILSYNQLASASDLSVGDTLIIPGGAMHATVAKTSKNSANPTKVTGGVASVGFSHPAPGSVKTQGIHGYNAVDLAGSAGSPIRAAAGGEVIVAKGGGWNGGYGTYIVIRHKNGTQTLYAHLSSLSVGVGSYVEQGQTIGGMGNTGKSTGTHLHFEVRGGKNPF